MTVQRITVWVTEPVRLGLDAHRAKCRRAEREWVAQRVAHGVKPRDARAEAARLRPERWPTQDVLVTAAVRKRLEREDLAGPWAPLTEAELGRMRMCDLAEQAQMSRSGLTRLVDRLERDGLLLVAARLGDVRLIDNTLLHVAVLRARERSPEEEPDPQTNSPGEELRLCNG